MSPVGVDPPRSHFFNGLLAAALRGPNDGVHLSRRSVGAERRRVSVGASFRTNMLAFAITIRLEAMAFVVSGGKGACALRETFGLFVTCRRIQRDAQLPRS